MSNVSVSQSNTVQLNFPKEKDLVYSDLKQFLKLFQSMYMVTLGVMQEDISNLDPIAFTGWLNATFKTEDELEYYCTKVKIYLRRRADTLLKKAKESGVNLQERETYQSALELTNLHRTNNPLSELVTDDTYQEYWQRYNRSFQIASINFNSPLTIELKGMLKALILAVAICGGEFEGLGFKVKMLGVVDSAIRIRHEFFGVEMKSGRDEIKDLMKILNETDVNKLEEVHGYRLKKLAAILDQMW